MMTRAPCIPRIKSFRNIQVYKISLHGREKFNQNFYLKRNSSNFSLNFSSVHVHSSTILIHLIYEYFGRLSPAATLYYTDV